jgi:hypothetical protein
VEAHFHSHRSLFLHLLVRLAVDVSALIAFHGVCCGHVGTSQHVPCVELLMYVQTPCWSERCIVASVWLPSLSLCSAQASYIQSNNAEGASNAILFYEAVSTKQVPSQALLFE